MKIDAHQHFWHYDPAQYTWIVPEMARIQRDFLPPELEPILDRQGFDASVAVQARGSFDDMDFLLGLAHSYPWIAKVVGWIDLTSPDAIPEMEKRALEPRVAGFRHLIQDEPPELLASPAFRDGMRALGEFDYTFDLLLLPEHLAQATDLVTQFPEQRFVIDHIAKPPIANGICDDWRRNMQTIAGCDNVFCKLSGMVTEADWHAWSYADFLPFMDCVLEAFDCSRLMYGSDWPVSLLAAEPDEVFGLMDTYLTSLAASERAQILGLTACDFYAIPAS